MSSLDRSTRACSAYTTVRLCDVSSLAGMNKLRALITLAVLSVFLALPAAAHASTDTTAPPDTIDVAVISQAPPGSDVPVIDGTNAEVSHDALEHADSLASIKVSSTAINFVVQTFLPILLGLIFKYRPKWMKVAGIVGSAVTAYIVSVTTTDGSALFTTANAWLFITGLATALFMYGKIWKPLNLTNAPGGKLGTENGI